MSRLVTWKNMALLEIMRPVILPVIQEVVDELNKLIKHVSVLQHAIEERTQRIAQVEDMVREINLLRNKDGAIYAFVCDGCGKVSSFAPGTENCRRCGRLRAKKALTAEKETD